MPRHPAFASHLAAATLLAAGFGVPAQVSAQTLPPGFALETVPFVFDFPTAVDFLPDGRLLVAEKGGIVYLVDGASRHPFWVHEEEVLNTDDRGLLGIAVDPAFDTNRFVYFLYSVDPDSNGIELDNYDDTFGRLTRYAVSTSEPIAVIESTRTVLIGRTWSEGFASGSGTHHIGDLAWGRDGTLLVSAGDGAHFTQVDQGGLDPGLFSPGRTNPLEDIGAFRAQDVASLSGKILRIDPGTGFGLASNPFYDGNPASNASRVWAYGCRNPFRMSVKPFTGSTHPADASPGVIYCNDTGWNLWEEVNVVRGAGMNFGWPCFDGPEAAPGYQAATPAHHGCGTIGSASNPSLPISPLVSLHHTNPVLSTPPGFGARVISAGAFTGAAYPAPWRNVYVVGDYARDWIKVVETNLEDSLVAMHDFIANARGPVDIARHPLDGDLYYVAIYSGEVHRIRWTGTADVADAGVSGAHVRLGPARPSPARGAVTMALELPHAAEVRMQIVDVSGREVWRAPARAFAAGRGVLAWDGRDAARAPVSPGIYLAIVEAAGERHARRVVQVR